MDSEIKEFLAEDVLFIPNMHENLQEMILVDPYSEPPTSEGGVVQNLELVPEPNLEQPAMEDSTGGEAELLEKPTSNDNLNVAKVLLMLESSTAETDSQDGPHLQPIEPPVSDLPTNPKKRRGRPPTGREPKPKRNQLQQRGGRRLNPTEVGSEGDHNLQPESVGQTPQQVGAIGAAQATVQQETNPKKRRGRPPTLKGTAPNPKPKPQTNIGQQRGRKSKHPVPPGFNVQIKVRRGGKSAGNKDKYYIENSTGDQFRSLAEVHKYLTDPSQAQKQSKKRKRKSSPSNGTQDELNEARLPEDVNELIERTRELSINPAPVEEARNGGS